MTDIKNSLQSLVSWKDSFINALGKEALIGKEPWDTLLEEFVGICEILNDPVTSAPLDTFAIQKLSPIDRLGLGPKLISLVEGGLTSEQISFFFTANTGSDISPKQIEDWLEIYEKSDITVRASVPNDVFDTRKQLQDLLDKVLDKLQVIENKTEQAFRRNSKDEVIAQYLDMVRAIIKDANAVQKEENSQKESQLFTQICLEVIQEVSPQLGFEIAKKLRARKILLLGSS